MKAHVQKTILKYGEKLNPYDIQKFNSNLVDPIKLLFDKSVYHLSWDEIVKNEIFRQRDKSNNNDIGYFHQNIFSYFIGCEVPDKGWDVIYRNPQGIILPDGDIVRSVYVEMKNKHNTMNSASSAKTYIKMQSQILDDDDCACFLVEAIAKDSQNIKWSTKVDGKNVNHKRIRRVSIDQFYSIVTGEDDAFYQLCMILPDAIADVVTEGDMINTPKDTVLDELEILAKSFNGKPEELSLSLAIYMLGFNNYLGFKDESSKFKYDHGLKGIYGYIREKGEYK